MECCKIHEMLMEVDRWNVVNLMNNLLELMDDSFCFGIDEMFTKVDGWINILNLVKHLWMLMEGDGWMLWNS
jgi:hypothetical protein